MVEKLGTTRVIHVGDESLADVKQELNDVGTEMSGHPSGLNDTLKHTSNGAKVSLLGIFPENVAIYSREMFETWYKMSSMIRAELDIPPVITHKFDYTEFEQGFATMLSGQSGKVVLEWS